MTEPTDHSDTPGVDGSLTDEVRRIGRISGGDRSGLGQKGWAEVPADRIGGHPELEDVPPSGPDGDLNGPRPKIDPATGAPVGRK